MVRLDTLLAVRAATAAKKLIQQGKPVVIETPQRTQGQPSVFSLDEYEEMKTNRQHSYEEAAKEKEVVAMESLVEEPETPSVNGGAPASEEPAPEEGGKGGKKKGKSKESKTEEGGTDRASKKKKGGGMFSKKEKK